MKLKKEIDNDKKIRKRKSLSKVIVSIKKCKNIDNKNKNIPIESEYFFRKGMNDELE